MLIRKAQTSKKIQLNVDSVSYWMATNNAKDNVLKRQYFELYGIPNGLRRLAHDYPFSPHRTSEPRPGRSVRGKGIVVGKAPQTVRYAVKLEILALEHVVFGVVGGHPVRNGVHVELNFLRG